MIEQAPLHRHPLAIPLAVSPADAARMAGIGRTKLYEALSSGSLTSFKIGARRLIRVSALQAWLEDQEAGGWTIPD